MMSRHFGAKTNQKAIARVVELIRLRRNRIRFEMDRLRAEKNRLLIEAEYNYGLLPEELEQELNK